MIRRRLAQSALTANLWVRLGSSDVSKQPPPSDNTTALTGGAKEVKRQQSPKTGEYLKPDGTPDFSTPVPIPEYRREHFGDFALGEGNEPGKYSKPPEKTYFEKAFPPHTSEEPATVESRSQNIPNPQHQTSMGEYENFPSQLVGGIGTHRYEGFVRHVDKSESLAFEDFGMMTKYADHHPDFDYTNRTMKHEFQTGNNQMNIATMDIKKAKLSLYRQCLKGIGFVKVFYMIPISQEAMKRRIRNRFMFNSHVEDPDAVRMLIYYGWTEYMETIGMRRNRNAVTKYFNTGDYAHEEKYDEMARLERQHIQGRAFYHGEEQRREGPYDGHWSEPGQEIAEEFAKLEGRIPKSWSTSKGYFEKLVPDGTNYWERNLDYEGWYLQNVNPDLKQAREDHAVWLESGYNQPKHYASKNRRGYRRMVKDIESLMQMSFEDLYIQNREQTFQYMLREEHPESNRVDAERRLALQDDMFLSSKWDEYEKSLKQVIREMPNPRMWKTDAFYFRLRYLLSWYEFNWAKVPIGREQEKQFNDWVSDSVNFYVLNSNAFESVKSDKARNPMAQTFSDFYNNFDPDVPESRRLPWFHKDFDYDRRHKWDERCMRMKRWVQSGTIDGKHAFFDSYIAEWEQYVNRPERFRRQDNTERTYSAPRMVQLYRALNKLMDVAMCNQMVAFMCARDKTTREALGKLSESQIREKVAAIDFSDFKFEVPVLVYPDGAQLPFVGLDGRPTVGAAA